MQIAVATRSAVRSKSESPARPAAGSQGTTNRGSSQHVGLHGSSLLRAVADRLQGWWGSGGINRTVKAEPAGPVTGMVGLATMEP